MGVAAALVVGGLSVAKGIGEFNSAKSQNRLIARQGSQVIENRKQEILQTAARQKIGYIQAGVELEGTAQNVMQDTYQTGIKDVQSLKYNYQQTIKNNLTQARASLLGNLASGAVSAYGMYGMSDLTGNAGYGALMSGGKYVGNNTYDLTGTAKTGGNVILTDSVYTGV